MSFNDLKLSELKSIAESFGVETPARVSKKEIILLLQEEGVSYQDYERFSGIEKQSAEELNLQPRLELKNEETILVKMERSNFSYQIGPVTFTSAHPYMALPMSFASEIFTTHEGFRPATPREVQEFYA